MTTNEQLPTRACELWLECWLRARANSGSEKEALIRAVNYMVEQVDHVASASPTSARALEAQTAMLREINGRDGYNHKLELDRRPRTDE